MYFMFKDQYKAFFFGTALVHGLILAFAMNTPTESTYFQASVHKCLLPK